MSRLEKVTGSLQDYKESIIVIGDRKKNLRPVSTEMLHNLMLQRTNEMLENFSSDLSCNSVLGGVPSEPSDWSIGLPCTILKPNQGWEKGKIILKVKAEFIPDEPELVPSDRPIEPSLDAFRESP